MANANHYSYSVGLTPDDYRQTYLSMGRHQGKAPTWIYPAAISVSIPVAIVLTSFTPYRPIGMGASMVLAFLCGMAAMIAVMRVVQLGVMQRLSVIGVEDWPRLSVTLDEDGVAAHGDGIMMQGRWPAVKDVTMEGGAIIVWLGRLQAVRIPERAFADSDERDAVMAFVRSRMTARPLTGT
jgi:hypothetical protein